ncbi:MAG: hypothetical protein OXC82_01385, partial [Rhodobacteraceae bacterium]|nr:hypothetical protein [Paracoccaceae bacterium]
QIDEDDLLIGFDAFHIHSKGPISPKIVEKTGLPFDWWEPGSTFTGTFKGLKLGGIRKHLDDGWPFGENLWASLARDDVSVDFQSNSYGSENSFTGLIKINGLPLARTQIIQDQKFDGETDSVLRIELSEINSQENQNGVTKEKANTARIAAIALIRVMFQWLPLQQEKLDVTEFSSFVDSGSSLDIFLP